MRTGGGSEGVAWEAEAVAKVTVSIPGYAMEVTKDFDHWPTADEIGNLAQAHVARHFPMAEVNGDPNLRPGDAGTSPEEKAAALAAKTADEAPVPDAPAAT